MPGPEAPKTTGSAHFVRRTGFWAGLSFFFLVLLMGRPAGLAPEGQRVLAVTVLMAVWWVTEAVPIPVTSLLPILLYPLLGVMSSDQVTGEYANDLIFLFFGGFFLALTLERWDLHRRLALHVMLLFGTRLPRMVLGVMCAVAVLSMWISNTATTLMMLPLCLALVEQVREDSADDALADRFSVALLLGTAYAANVGGMGTPIGTAPNGVFLRVFDGALRPSFAEWMAFGVPLVIVFVVVIWVLLTKVLHRLPAREETVAADIVRTRLAAMGRLSREERAVMGVFGLTVLLWVFRGGLGPIPGWVDGLRALGLTWLANGARSGVGDSAVAILAVLLLCTLRVRRGGKPLADWRLGIKVPWGMLLLFGGGFAIAQGFQASSGDLKSLSAWVGGGIGQLMSLHPLVVIVCTSTILSFLTEFTSNTATTAVTVPILASLGDPDIARLVCLAATLSASCAFMFPVATPPNAIVFASEKVPMRTMMKTGILFNFVGIILVSAAVWGIARWSLP